MKPLFRGTNVWRLAGLGCVVVSAIAKTTDISTQWGSVPLLGAVGAVLVLAPFVREAISAWGEKK